MWVHRHCHCRVRQIFGCEFRFSIYFSAFLFVIERRTVPTARDLSMVHALRENCDDVKWPFRRWYCTLSGRHFRSNDAIETNRHRLMAYFTVVRRLLLLLLLP